MENPFIKDLGGIVYGERFRGRAVELRQIEQRLLSPNGSANMAFIGLKKVGKSSLAWQGLVMQSERLKQQKVLVAWVNVSTSQNQIELFSDMMKKAFSEIRKAFPAAVGTLVFPKREEWATLTEWGDFKNALEEFFSSVRDSGYRVIFVLDEFDGATRVFSNQPAGFQELRELSYNPKFGVKYLALSRKKLSDIEVATPGSSTLAETFQPRVLKMFCCEDMRLFWDTIYKCEVPIDEPIRSKFQHYCGNYPHILDVLGCAYIERHINNDSSDVESWFVDAGKGLIELNYRKLVQTLTEEKLLNKLVEIVIGPAIDVTQFDVDEFEEYGLIIKDKVGFRPFSEHFMGYLEVIARDIPLWPVWARTEESIRRVVLEMLQKKYTSGWVAALEGKEKLFRIMGTCRDRRAKAVKSFGSRAPDNLLLFTYPGELFAIISTEWNLFVPVLGKNTDYWEKRFSHLAKIRNPLCHNWDVADMHRDKLYAEEYCNEILGKLDSWEENKDKPTN